VAKLPWMKFFPNDYLADTRGLSPEEKGMWMDLICYAWQSPTRGTISYPIDSLSRMLGASREALEAVLKSLRFQGIAEITFDSHANVTVVSRRMLRDEKERDSARLRKQRERSHTNVTEESRHDVTPMSHQCHGEKLEARSQKSEKGISCLEEGEEIPFEKPPKEEKTKDPFLEKDNGKDQEKEQAFGKQLTVISNRMMSKWPRFNVYLFRQKNMKKNTDAIIHALNQTYRLCTSQNPGRYAQEILDKESGNFNEKEYLKENEGNKELYSGIVEAIKKIQPRGEK
jgi:uncharacterized protein YdaU (DUF1376 family)